MSVVEKTLLTPQEYLARERQAEFRSEYYRGEMFAMSGASWVHTLIKDNLSQAMRNRLNGVSLPRIDQRSSRQSQQDGAVYLPRRCRCLRGAAV